MSCQLKRAWYLDFMWAVICCEPARSAATVWLRTMKFINDKNMFLKVINKIKIMKKIKLLGPINIACPLNEYEDSIVEIIKI